jgi:KDO2-lipid IV(A) lauroyltransferase
MKKGKILRRWIVYQLTLFGLFLAGKLEISTGLWLGARLGRIIFYLLPRERSKSLTGLQLAFPEKTEGERYQIAKKSFENLGKCFFEFIYYSQRPRQSLDDIVEVEGLEHFDEALAQGKGVISITAHIGNWELMGMYLIRKGYPVTVLAREVNNEGINRLMMEIHQKNGMATILRKKDWGTLKRIIQVLYDNHMLGMLIDQDARVPAVFVDFFGKPARTPSGPVSMALSTGAKIVTGFIVRKPDDRHRIIIKPVPIKKVGTRSENVLHNTWVLTEMAEQLIRQYPDQWVWMHRRWRRQPKENERSYPSQIQIPALS